MNTTAPKLYPLSGVVTQIKHATNQRGTPYATCKLTRATRINGQPTQSTRTLMISGKALVALDPYLHENRMISFRGAYKSVKNADGSYGDYIVAIGLLNG